MVDKGLLSTGQAARRCAVTPDTVLKWIKKGKLPASRTAGGHYRVRPQDIEELLQSAQWQPEPISESDFVHCWEFHANGGRTLDNCKTCVVYKARATRCFELSHLTELEGYSGTYCQSTCLDCAYYQTQFKERIRVLVVTSSHDRRAEILLEEQKFGALDVNFSSSDYETATEVERIRPHYIVLDCLSSPQLCHDLGSHLQHDARIPDTVLLTTCKGADRAGKDALLLPEDFGIRALQKVIWFHRHALAAEQPRN